MNIYYENQSNNSNLNETISIYKDISRSKEVGSMPKFLPDSAKTFGADPNRSMLYRERCYIYSECMSVRCGVERSFISHSHLKAV